jgi:hypothetical protein
MIRDDAKRGCSTTAHPPPIILGLCAWHMMESTEERCRSKRFVRCRESVISANFGFRAKQRQTAHGKSEAPGPPFWRTRLDEWQRSGTRKAGSWYCS